MYNNRYLVGIYVSFSLCTNWRIGNILLKREESLIFIPDVGILISELSELLKSPLASWGQWPSVANVPLFQNWAESEQTRARWGMRQSAQPRQLEIQPGIWVIRSAFDTPYWSIIISVLRRPQVFFIIICGSYLHHIKRNKDKKSQGCCPRGQCPRYWHKSGKRRTRQERGEEMLTSNKNKPRYYLSRIVPTNTWQQRTLALVEFWLKFVKVTRHFHKTHLLQYTYTRVITVINNMYYSWQGFMTSTKVMW